MTARIAGGRAEADSVETAAFLPRPTVGRGLIPGSLDWLSTYPFRSTSATNPDGRRPPTIFHLLYDEAGANRHSPIDPGLIG